MPSKLRLRRPVSAWLLLGVSAVGLTAALALPFAPVHAERTVLTWPAPGAAVMSSTAQVLPYRPTEMSASVPCAAVAAARARPERTTVLATAPDAEGLVLYTDNGVLRMLPGDRVIDLPDGDPGCALTVRAAHSEIEIGGDAAPQTVLDAPVPKVLAFRTALSPDDAVGMTMTVRVDDPFATRPSVAKVALVVVALLAAAIVLVLLHSLSPSQPSWPRPPPPSSRWHLMAIDAAVVAVLCGWAVIGPLAVDDGWATTIARNVADTGSPGNYYRWWNAAESPFAFSQQLLAPLTQVSLAPLWLRLPSTVLAVATWFVFSRGLLGVALPAVASSVWVRVLAATALLAAWLPFNLGTRPEGYVALGLVVVLTLLWRSRAPATLGWASLTAALVLPVSPSAVMVVAPAALFAPRIVRIVGGAGPSRTLIAGTVAALCCLVAVAFVVVFADETWEGVRTATRWHTEFGPSLPWYRETERYAYLLGDSQQGSAAKRIPVLLSLALVPTVVALAVRRRPGATARSALRMAGVLVLALALLAFAPSKWSYHLGAAAGLFAALLTVGVVALARFTRSRITLADRVTAVIGALIVACAATLCFSGSNAWWLPVLYDVPWADGPIRPLGVPLSAWWLWPAGAVVAALVAVASSRRDALLVVPGLVAGTAAAVSVTLLLASFTVAPVRRPQGSLALVNIDRLTAGPYCGLADDIEVLADGPPLLSAGPATEETGFVPLGGFDPDAPPPDAPGTGMSTHLWGSRGAAAGTGRLISPWFVLPPGASVAVSVNGRGHGASAVRLEFGRAGTDAVTPVGPAVAPEDTTSGEDNSLHPAWRSVGLDAAGIPPGADRMRVLAVDDAADRDGWLAVTGPRTRSTLPLNDFLADRGPVLISWPQGFLFPCLPDIARVSAGVAQVPRVVIASPGPWFTEPTDQSLGGSFAALVPYSRFYEVPSRVVGRPDAAWGAVLLSADPTPHDTYRRETATVTRWGHRVSP
ncbi:arabinosyltransferase domain-containing protein [Mycobacterium manitobense]|uniref:Arabinosyltransferase domain-containing protein n=1 Tax=[Mycobacterium] manitobense TaxID=190147 RepID=A0A9X2YKH1_9MYCO|nr:arabinosyltransferase [[Mycobacterium] manitobense]MCV7168941.1 arabinosyltransferase domain-containing protein [[Mycobacterium] manitobense]